MKIANIQEVTRLLPTTFIPRTLTHALEQSLTIPEVTVLYGPRQVGKSAIVLQLMKQLVSQHPAPDIFYFTLDHPRDDFDDPDQFLRSIMAKRPNSTVPCYIFIDEAQRINNVGVFIKYLYDLQMNIKFILTGSASLDIKQKIKEPLTGRKREFYLPPLTLTELLAYRGLKMKEEGSIRETQELLDEYLLFGGYPGVVLAPSREEKMARITEIADSYIFRDISELFTIQNIQSLRILVSFAAENIGNLVSRDNLSTIASVSKYEVEKMMTAIEKTFIVWLAHPFAKNRAKELIHRPKLYFHDTGIRNAVLRKLDPHLIAADKGKLFENVVANELKARYGQDVIKFWRTHNQTEVDFVVSKPTGKVDIVEAKYSWDTEKLPPNMRSFTDLYKDIVDTARVISKENYWTI